MDQRAAHSKHSWKGGSKKKSQMTLKEKSFNSEKKRKLRKEKYRSKMGNKSEGQGFAIQKKTLVQHNYKKLLRKEQGNLESQSTKIKEIYREMSSSNPMASAEERLSSDTMKSRSRPKKKSRFFKAQIAFKQTTEEAKRKSQEKKRQREEREMALNEYTQKKQKRHKKLAKKNFRGQPVMASQMELLLQKLENQKS